MKRIIAGILLYTITAFSVGCAKQVAVSIPDMTKAVESIAASNMPPEAKSPAIQIITQTTERMQRAEIDSRQSTFLKVLEAIAKGIDIGAGIATPILLAKYIKK